MKCIISRLLFLSLILVPALASATVWNLDPDHSSIGFKVRHLMVTNVTGSFDKSSGMVRIDDRDITKSSVSVTIDTASVNTGVRKRDDHLRSADFFDVARFPTMTFTSKKIIATGSDRLKVTGDLTIRGITREVVLDVEGPTKEIRDPWGHTRRGASAVTRINRKDFGLVWNKALETGGVAVGDEVSIMLDVEMIKEDK